MKVHSDGTIDGLVVSFSNSHGFIEGADGKTYAFFKKNIAGNKVSPFDVIRVRPGTKVAFRPDASSGILSALEVDFYSTDGIEVERRSS